MILLSFKRSKKINLQRLAIRVSRLEGGKVNLPIAQISEVQARVLDELADEWATNPKGVAQLLGDRHHRRKGLRLSLMFLAMLCVLLTGCGAHFLGPQTQVDPAEASVDRISDDKAIAEDDEQIIRIRISPASPPAAPAEPEVQPLYYVDPGVEPDVVQSDSVTVDLGDGRKIDAPPGSEVVIEVVKQRKRDPKGGKEVISSKGRSIGLSTREGGIAGSMEFEAPDVGEDRASGGDFSFGWKGLSANKGSVTLYIIGGLMIVAGVVVALLLKRIGLGLMVAAAGVGVMFIGVVFERYFWALWIVAAGVAVWFIFQTRAGARLRAAFMGVIRGVDKAEPGKGPVKRSIEAEDDGTIKAEVGKLKTQMGGSYAHRDQTTKTPQST